MPKVHVIKGESDYVCEYCGLDYDECECQDSELHYSKYATKEASVKKSSNKWEWGSKNDR